MLSNLENGITLVTDHEAEGDAQQYIRNRLRNHNLNIAPTDQVPNILPLNIVVRNGAGEIIAGLIGYIYRHCFHLDILWVDDAHRGSGLGTRMLREMEAVVRDRGCRMIHLDTFSFQAPVFYQRHGYEIFGVLDGYPDDIRRYYFKKLL